MTKSYAAAAVMRLVDEGKLALEDSAYIHIDPVM
jgi:CubicO group peptidase (beta-lactamase class C family)